MLLFCVLPGLFRPYFHLLNASFSWLGSVRNSHCSQATLLTHLLIFLGIGMDQPWDSRSCHGRSANCARALCLGILPPRVSLCQFPERAELCFHVEQVGDVASGPHLLGIFILPPFYHCSFRHETGFVSWSFRLYPSFLLACPTQPWINYPYQFQKFLDCFCVQQCSPPSTCWVAPQPVSLHCSKRFFLAGCRALQWSHWLSPPLCKFPSEKQILLLQRYMECSASHGYCFPSHTRIPCCHSPSKIVEMEIMAKQFCMFWLHMTSLAHFFLQKKILFRQGNLVLEQISRYFIKKQRREGDFILRIFYYSVFLREKEKENSKMTRKIEQEEQLLYFKASEN